MCDVKLVTTHHRVTVLDKHVNEDPHDCHLWVPANCGLGGSRFDPPNTPRDLWHERISLFSLSPQKTLWLLGLPDWQAPGATYKHAVQAASSMANLDVAIHETVCIAPMNDGLQLSAPWIHRHGGVARHTQDNELSMATGNVHA